ncbi:MAG: ABC transporter permease subunit [Catenulispora sp.]|nr:ABC transporter permease subunit [Catenulispora sp.]
MHQTRDGFLQTLHAEWTKLRTVPRWMTAMAATALLPVLVAVLAGISSVRHDDPPVPIGPGGEPVSDSFYFVHRSLAGDGSITVAVSGLEDKIPEGPGDLRSGIVPWAKAGLIIKDGTRQGSSYAAIMVTSANGVRMQADYTEDSPGLPGPVSTAAPRWLRLERTGHTVAGYDSADGVQWTLVGAVRLDALGPTAQGGLFVASPPSVDGTGGTRSSVSTAAFGVPRTLGDWTGADGAASGGASADWTGEQIGPESPTFAGYPQNTSGSFTRSAAGLTVTGAGDLAPAVRETLPTGGDVGEILTGTFAALIAAIVVGTLFVTAEYRSGLIRLTLSASPGRVRVLIAKAIVIATATFVAGLAGTAVAAPLGEHLARANGVYLFPASAATELRVQLGTAALLAAASILALAVGTILRHGAGAVTVVTLAMVLPRMLIAVPFLPAGIANWLTRLTPTAAFAVQQTLVPYRQVASIYTPYEGYYPLAPWAGLAVLVAYAAVTLAIAAFLLHRRDV